VVSFTAAGTCVIDASQNGNTDWNAAPQAQQSFQVTNVTTTLLGSATDLTGGTKTSTVTSVATTSGKTELILVYRQSSVSGETVSSITGPFSGTPTSVTTNQDFNSSKTSLSVWKATGNGNTANVVVTFSGNNKNVVTAIHVVQLSGNSTSTPIVQTTAASGTNATATASLTGITSGDAEIALIGTTTSTSISTPANFSVIHADSGATGSGFDFKSAFYGAAQSALSSTLGAASGWGTIALEVGHA
jgi:hypothetical protein